MQHTAEIDFREARSRTPKKALSRRVPRMGKVLFDQHSTPVHCAVKELTNNGETVVNFGALPYREREVMRSQADTRKLTGLGWRLKFNLRDGIEQTVESHRQLRNARRAA